MSFFDDMHAPFRRSRAENLRKLTRALERGVNALRLREVVATMFLESAKRNWLDEYASLYAYVRRPSETDEQLRARMQRDTILERMKTTDLAIAASILDATGITVNIVHSRTFPANFDELESSVDGEAMLDYSEVIAGVEVFENTPESSRGYRGRGPWRPGYGPGGTVIDVLAPYNANTEATIIQAFRDKIPSMMGFDLNWVKDLQTQWENTTSIDEDGVYRWSGWGEDPWDAPWDGDSVYLGGEGWGVTPWGEGWSVGGDLPRRRYPIPNPGVMVVL